MKKLAPLFLGLVALLGLGWVVQSQVVPSPGPPTAIACAFNTSPVTIPSGSAGWVQCDDQGQVKTTGSFSASVSGFTAASTGTPITATTGGVTGSLPAGAVVVATNVGTTNAAYCQLGGAVSLSSQYIAPNGGWFAFTVGGSTQLTCRTSASTTVVNLTGGAGLPTGTGGGSGGGGGGGGAITAPLGTQAIADSVAVQPATSSTWAATQSGTWTVQPGNTANTTPWLVTGSGTAGSAATGVLTVQGIASMTPLLANPGTAANWGVGVTGAAIPANAQLNGIAVGGNLRGPTGLGLGSHFAQTVAIVDASGNQITSFGGSGGTASNFGSAFPSAGTAIGGTDGTNMVGIRVGAIANLAAATNFMNVAPGCRYDATPPVLTDTRFNQLQCDVSGSLNVNVTGAVGISQGSLTSGQTGSLVFAAASSVNPTATGGNSYPLSMTPSGGLRVQNVWAGGFLDQNDPCMSGTPTSAPISITSATTTRLVTQTASQRVYICHITLQTAIANNIGIIEGTGGTCGTSTAGVVGGTTAANGLNFAANQGISVGNGRNYVWATAGTNVEFCLITSSAGPLTGHIKYVKQ